MKFLNAQFSLFSLLVETCYFYAVYALVTGAVRLPEPKGLVMFLFIAFFALVINLALKSKNRRLLTIYLINLLLAIFTVSYFVKSIYFIEYSIIDFSWVKLVFSLKLGFKSLVSIWTLVIYILAIWFRARILSIKPGTIKGAVTRLELSMVIIFVVFLIAGLTSLPLSGSMPSLVGALLSNVGALALIRGSRGFNHNYHGIVILFFAGLLILLGVMINYFFPLLSKLIEVIYKVAHPMLAGLGNLLTGLFIFVFKKGFFMVPESTTNRSTGNFNPEVNISKTFNIPNWLQPFFEIVKVLGLIIILLIVAGFIWYLGYRLLTRLSRVEDSNFQGFSLGLNWLDWWLSLIKMLSSKLDNLVIFFSIFFIRKMDTLKAYRALLKWGSHRNHPRKLDETPIEYCQRLIKYFPHKKKSLIFITQCFITYKYGNKDLSNFTIKELSLAVRDLYCIF